MCLYSRQILPRRATKDITVYKELYVDETLLRTAYRLEPVFIADFGKIIKACGIPHIQRFAKGDIFQEFHCVEIGAGFIHSYKTFPIMLAKDKSCMVTKTETVRGAYIWHYGKLMLSHTHKLVECTIPRGSLYWIGVFNDICSDQIIYNKVLSIEEIIQILNKQ